MDEGVQEVKLVPLWARIVSWIFGAIITVMGVTIFIVGSWSLGSSMLEEIKTFGIIQSLIALGIGGLTFLFSGLVVTLLIAIIRRITKLKWLQIPFE